MMKSRQLTALAVMVTMLAAASAFADSRHRNETYGGDGRWDRGRVITVEGRIRDIDRERNGFVIRLHNERLALYVDRDRRRMRDLDEGDVIRATGVVRDGVLRANRIDVIRDRDRGRDWGEAMIAGSVDGVDARRGIIWIRDARSRRSIRVEVRDDVELYYLRRGERVTVRGDWRRDGTFMADRVRVER